MMIERNPHDQRLGSWRNAWGCGYAYGFKRANLSPLFDQMEEEGKIGAIILDAGSGSMGSWKEDNARAPYYPTNGKKIVRADIGMPYLYKKTSGILELQADIENLLLDSPLQMMRLAHIKRHLGLSQSQLPQFDTILFSDILNYVDYKKAISGLMAFLKAGGRIVINNTPMMGIKEKFSDNGVKSNIELLDFLADAGLRLEHAQQTPMMPFWLADAAPIRYPAISQVISSGNLIAVAVNDPAG